jgi:hypothetical protein
MSWVVLCASRPGPDHPGNPRSVTHVGRAAFSGLLRSTGGGCAGGVHRANHRRLYGSAQRRNRTRLLIESSSASEWARLLDRIAVSVLVRFIRAWMGACSRYIPLIMLSKTPGGLQWPEGRMGLARSDDGHRRLCWRRSRVAMRLMAAAWSTDRRHAQTMLNAPPPKVLPHVTEPGVPAFTIPQGTLSTDNESNAGSGPTRT